MLRRQKGLLVLSASVLDFRMLLTNRASDLSETLTEFTAQMAQVALWAAITSTWPPSACCHSVQYELFGLDASCAAQLLPSKPPKKRRCWHCDGNTAWNQLPHRSAAPNCSKPHGGYKAHCQGAVQLPAGCRCSWQQQCCRR
jgi:hypothetical protein